jgi:hypothetical protein
MARPMTHTQFTDLMKTWGIDTVDNSRGGVKWYNHNRNSKGKWGEVYGSMNHHTGAADNKAGRDVLWNGYASLPGPLCHGGITADGKVLLNGWGRTNHAGLGDDDILDLVISEDYTGLPRPNEANTDGNRRFYGWEWMYDGLSDPIEEYPKLYKTAVRLNAAICTFHNWTAKSCIGHGNWQQGKWDPGVRKGIMFSIPQFQNHVEQAIKEGPNPKKPLPQRPTNPAPTKPGSITIAKGDTLMSLAEKHLGDAKRWAEFVPGNPSLVRSLRIGEKLTVPKK